MRRFLRVRISVGAGAVVMAAPARAWGELVVTWALLLA